MYVQITVTALVLSMQFQEVMPDSQAQLVPLDRRSLYQQHPQHSVKDLWVGIDSALFRKAITGLSSW